MVCFAARGETGGSQGSELKEHPSLKESIAPLWAAAIYELHLTAEAFYSLTPSQFALLVEAHRKHLEHDEMIQAYTTAAIINYSMGAPESPAQPLLFMPSYREATGTEPAKPKMTADDVIDWQARVAQLAAELKQGHGPTLDRINANGKQ